MATDCDELLRSPQWAKFWADSLGKLADMGININMVAAPGGPESSAGVFDSSSGYIRVSIGSKDWPLVYVHEYCHALQTRYPKVYWDEGVYRADSESGFDRSEVSEEAMERRAYVARQMQLCELDCEHATVRHFRAYRMPVDIPAYIQEANVYGLFWTYVGKRGMPSTWLNEQVYARMRPLVPTRWLTDYSITREMESIFDSMDSYDMMDEFAEKPVISRW